jgi:predicted DNA-binding WGR domain protein
MPNLFGEFIVIRTYGSLQKSKPTGEIKEVYSNQADAQHSIDVLIASKHKRGYRSKPQNH